MTFAQILPSPGQKYVQCFPERHGIDSSFAWLFSPLGNLNFSYLGNRFLHCPLASFRFTEKKKNLSSASAQWVTGLWVLNILGYLQQIIFSKNDDILFYCSHDLNLCGIAIEVNRTFSWVRFAGYSIIKIWQLIVLFMLLHLMNKYISLNIRLSFVYTL